MFKQLDSERTEHSGSDTVELLGFNRMVFSFDFFFLDQSMSVFNGIAKCFVFTVVEKD